uniref:DUF3263 domain-containing protein n=1 Tax=Microbacterium sp. LWO14-1.2 TaxID=3135263 RepID=UPI00405347BD
MSVARGRIGTVTPADLLAFEAAHPPHTPAKGEVIRRGLGISDERYYQLLARAASSSAGIAADPITARLVRNTLAKGRHASTAHHPAGI